MPKETEPVPPTHQLAENENKSAPDTFARAMLVDGVKHRRDKDWKIFASTTSILLAIIAAVVAISARPGFVSFSTRQKVILVFTLSVLTIAAGVWIGQNLCEEKQIIEQLSSGKYHLNRLKRVKWATGYLPALGLILAITLWAIFWLPGVPPPPAKTNWYFAVSGDSRDCGDLIMPKIAQAIADGSQTAPVDFYWHLGDLRAIYRIDCDMAKIKDPSFQCVPESASPSETQAMRNEYLSAAWPNFINSQIRPFEKLTCHSTLVLGITN
jgi:hypothetical protein